MVLCLEAYPSNPVHLRLVQVDRSPSVAVVLLLIMEAASALVLALVLLEAKCL